MSGDLQYVHRFVRGSGSITLLLLHGTGGDENDLLPFGHELEPDASLLSPRGRVLENGMPRFFRRLAMGVFDLQDLIDRTHELARFVKQAVQRYGLDGNHIVAVGYSNGANIAASLLLLHPQLLRGAALLHAMVPFNPQDLPDLRGRSVLLTAGRRDPMVPVEQANELARLFEDSGADVTPQWFPGGHQITEAEGRAVRAWLQNLKKKEQEPV